MTTTQRGHEPAASAALAAVLIALLMGVAGDLLLRTDRPGINVWIMSALLQIMLLLLYRRYQVPVPRAAFGLLMLGGLFLLSFAWRDSAALNGMALLAAFTSAGLAAWLAQGALLLRATVMQYCEGLVRSSVGVWVGVLPLVFSDVQWSQLHRGGNSSRLVRVGRGLALAVPPVIVFGALFAEADPIFSSLYRGLFDLDLTEVVSHGFLIGFVAWGVGGYVRQLVIPRRPDPAGLVQLTGGKWGFIEVAVMLGAVNLIFLLFVSIQLRALFGGETFILSQTGLTYAEYARQGFFHMAWAAALVLPLLLFAEWVSQRNSATDERSFRALAVLLLFLIGVVLVSAVQRMRIYQVSFGLTELRVYTMAFMVWLAAVLAWFGLTVLRDRRDRFAPGALGMAFALVLVLHLINPDRYIARTNLDRATRGLSFDGAHAATLSDDAVPVLVEALPYLPQADRCALLNRLEASPDDWRSWNQSRERAGRLIRQHARELAELRQACPALEPKREYD